eukprot:CAMPEP_0172555966 /NCGR_PEP_ID=MMETSP1067-20121228/62037_1 /TAXON_ID=265564 ORGANISM="Thalassiosira punctigera, Strain Tpunct2005C2" /NCGR_SAMPLE_ID=MMETSP1067 /ASSEMBLY_ACC=CAM_ASM_000444 /LENGTH=646 /DNA_ID=CAMNT_0013344617 /DNA_START=62 /DNA_END=2002 /DNA_ORIENTATION=-
MKILSGVVAAISASNTVGDESLRGAKASLETVAVSDNIFLENDLVSVVDVAEGQAMIAEKGNFARSEHHPYFNLKTSHDEIEVTEHKDALLPDPHLSSTSSITVGDEVCITGYIMDNYCIFDTGGTLLDNPKVITLKNPELHSFYCLLDVNLCYESGFVVLGDKNPDTDRHCLGFKLDDTDAVLKAGRALGKKGSCSTCTGETDANPQFGYRATVKGMVKEMGDGSDGVDGPPVLTNIQLLDESVGCDDNPTTPPLCAQSADVVPSRTKEPTKKPTESATNSNEDSIPAPPCPDTLDGHMDIDESATFYYAIVPSNPAESNNGILCGRLEVENDGWIGFATARDVGTLFMNGAEAIIGVPEENSVLKYDLTGTATAMSTDSQTLMNTSITQDDGKTTMEFAKLLVEDGEIPIVEKGENTFLHARGGSSLGYHGVTSRVSFKLDLSSGTRRESEKSLNPSSSSDLKVGDDVCITNFIMDQYCIDLGTLLDDPNTMTLKNPEKHSFHCLLDVHFCKDSGYVVLGDKSEKTGMHCLGFRLDDAATVIQAGLAAGRKGTCTDCTGDNTKPEFGYRATVKGKVKELGNENVAPILENIQVLDASVECETTIVPPLCEESAVPLPPEDQESSGSSLAWNSLAVLCLLSTFLV